MEYMDDVQEDLNQEIGSEDENQVIGNDDNSEGLESSEESEGADKEDPYSIKKRLGMQAKRYQREMRALQEQVRQLHSQVNQPNDEIDHSQNPYHSPGQPSAPSGDEEERIQRAVRYALQAKDAEERHAQEAEGQMFVQKQYMRLNDDFDKASEKYEDFDEVVRGSDVPFSSAIRDALLTIDNPADVAYKLGKNHEDLKRISKLHPLEQVREVNRVSKALMGGNNKASTSANGTRPMSQIKANPLNASSTITDKTPVSTIRDMMKAGTWK